jgi:hypothetical protein
MEHEYIHADPGTAVDANYAIFSDPKKPLVIEGIEHKVESIIGKDVRVFLWVDINGLKIVDAHKKVVQWSARLNTIVQVRVFVCVYGCVGMGVGVWVWMWVGVGGFLPASLCVAVCLRVADI